MFNERDPDWKLDAKADEAMERKGANVTDCIEYVEGFEWRWRIINSAIRKIVKMKRSNDPVEVKKANDLARRIRHLQKWCDDALNENEDAHAEAAMADADPYRYYGVSRSDF
jgi:hypothetical protein